MVMAITATAIGVAYNKLVVTFVDAMKNVRNVTYPVVTTAANQDIITFLTALDAVSQAQICQYKLLEQLYDVDGQEAATTARFSSTYDKINIVYESADLCSASLTIVVPAPVEAVLTGTQLQLVDGTVQTMIDLTSAAIDVLIEPKSGKTDLVFNLGWRDVDQLSKPTIF